MQHVVAHVKYPTSLKWFPSNNKIMRLQNARPFPSCPRTFSSGTKQFSKTSSHLLRSLPLLVEERERGANIGL